MHYIILLSIPFKQMEGYKRKLRPRAKSTIERVTIDPDFRDKSPQCPAKPNLKRAPSSDKENSENVATSSATKPDSKRRSVMLRPILKKVPLNKNNQLESMPEVVIRNCTLTNMLFESHKKFEDKCEDLVRLNGQFCAATIENMKLKQELSEKDGEIERLTKIVEEFERGKFCQDLIEFDGGEPNEGLHSLVFETPVNPNE